MFIFTETLAMSDGTAELLSFFENNVLALWRSVDSPALKISKSLKWASKRFSQHWGRDGLSHVLLLHWIGSSGIDEPALRRFEVKGFVGRTRDVHVDKFKRLDAGPLTLARERFQRAHASRAVFV